MKKHLTLLAQGTLVQVDVGAIFRPERDGTLWLVDYLKAPKDNWYWCKSIATGAYYEFPRLVLTPYQQGDTTPC